MLLIIRLPLFMTPVFNLELTKVLFAINTFFRLLPATMVQEKALRSTFKKKLLIRVLLAERGTFETVILPKSQTDWIE